MRVHWTIWCAIYMMFLRLCRFNGDDSVVPQWSMIGYTYHDVWYNAITRVMELMVFSGLYHYTKNRWMLLFAFWGFWKILDELCVPFYYWHGEFVCQLFSWIMLEITFRGKCEEGFLLKKRLR